MRETPIENHFARRIQQHGGRAYKFTSPARRSVPDRLRLSWIPPEHREIVARYISFAELKATGKDATPAQKREHKRLRDLGFRVDVINSKDGVERFIEEIA